MKKNKFPSIGCSAWRMFDKNMFAVNSLTNHQTVINAKESLNLLLVHLGWRDNNSVIKDGLDFFRKEFEIRTIMYPGDSIYYSMFERGIKKGLDVESSFLDVQRIVLREMILLDTSLRWGSNYNFDWH